MMKVGDKVKLRDDLEVGKFYDDCVFVIAMLDLKNKEFTIINNDYGYYQLDCVTPFFFNKQMLELVDKPKEQENKQRTVIIVKDNYAELYEDLKEKIDSFKNWFEDITVEQKEKLKSYLENDYYRYERKEAAITTSNYEKIYDKFKDILG